MSKEAKFLFVAALIIVSVVVYALYKQGKIPQIQSAEEKRIADELKRQAEEKKREEEAKLQPVSPEVPVQPVGPGPSPPQPEPAKPKPEETKAEETPTPLEREGEWDWAKKPVFFAAIGVPLAPFVLRKISSTVAKKAATAVARVELAIANRSLEKLGIKLGEKTLETLGLRATERLAAQTGAKAATGGMGGPLLLAFDVATIALDLGDAGGYLSQGSKYQYLLLKETVDETAKQIYKEAGLPYPGIAGPYDQWTDQKLQDELSATTTEVCLDQTNPVMKAIYERLNAAKLTSEAAVSDFMEKEITANWEAISEEAKKLMCTKNRGKLTTVEGFAACSWATKDACEASYQWPLPTKPHPETGKMAVYAEWNPKEERCEARSEAMRVLCEEANLPYDMDRGICKITENYCLGKGADWGWNPKINEDDCVINDAQEFFELLVGTTITRYFKQVFDPAQYMPCASGETDIGYACTIGSYPRGAGTIPSLHDYAKSTYAHWPWEGCDSGYSNHGLWCSKNCDSGYTDTGEFCHKADCGDKEYDAGLCYERCRAGYHGIGPVCWSDSGDFFRIKKRKVPYSQAPAFGPALEQNLKGIVNTVASKFGAGDVFEPEKKERPEVEWQIHHPFVPSPDLPACCQLAGPREPEGGWNTYEDCYKETQDRWGKLCATQDDVTKCQNSYCQPPRVKASATPPAGRTAGAIPCCQTRVPPPPSGGMWDTFEDCYRDTEQALKPYCSTDDITRCQNSYCWFPRIKSTAKAPEGRGPGAIVPSGPPAPLPPAPMPAPVATPSPPKRAPITTMPVGPKNM